MPKALRCIFKSSASTALLFILCSLSTNAQDSNCEVPNERSAEKAVKTVYENSYTPDDYNKLLSDLKEIIEYFPENAPALASLGRVQFEIAQQSQASFKNAVVSFKQALAACPDYDPSIYYFLGVAYYGDGNLNASINQFRKFLASSENPIDPDYEARYENTQKMLPKIVLQRDINKGAEMAKEPFLLKGVSTSNSEYLPVLSPDNSLLLYTRMERKKMLGDKVTREVETLSVSNKMTSKFAFDKGGPMEEPINMFRSGNYGGATLSLDNKELYYTICLPDSSGYRNCNIYKSNKIINAIDDGIIYYLWTDPKPELSTINEKGSWQSQPTISTDGTMLLFAKYSETTQGIDIYYSQRSSKNKPWSTAQPLPGYINTAGNEKAPFIHPDTKTLYFSSDGLQGAGGYDIYMTQQVKGSWTDPINLGGGINTPDDEISFVVSLDGQYGVFASNKNTATGLYDLYGIELPSNVRPDNVTILKGKIDNAIENTEVEISNKEGKIIDKVSVDATDGSYAVVLKKEDVKDDLVVAVKKPGYAFDSHLVTLKSTDGGLLTAEQMKLEEIELDKPYRINDIFFETNSARLTASSKQILDKFSEFLQVNPSFQVLIQGHTDNVGAPAANLTLSLNRAKAVKEYLITKGISAGRLNNKGYGEKMPIASNDSEEGRAKNRRTEFVITKK